MADTKISALPSAGALTGTEIVPVDQAGATVQTTAAAIAALAPAGSVTHTAGPLVLGQPVLGNGGADVAAAGYALAGTAAQTYTLPTATDTIAGLTATQTFTNKRVTQRTVATAANTATYTINTDITDIYKITGQTLAIANITPGGFPTDGQALFIDITATATTALTFGANFAAGLSALPTTTNGTALLMTGFRYNAASGLWLCMFGPVAKSTLALSGNSATPAVNTDLTNNVEITAQVAAITNFTTNLTGTPGVNDSITYNITGAGAVALTWGTGFEASTVALPTTTVGGAKLTVGFIRNTVTAKWRCVAVA